MGVENYKYKDWTGTQILTHKSDTNDRGQGWWYLQLRAVGHARVVAWLVPVSGVPQGSSRSRQLGWPLPRKCLGQWGRVVGNHTLLWPHISKGAELRGPGGCAWLSNAWIKWTRKMGLEMGEQWELKIINTRSGKLTDSNDRGKRGAYIDIHWQTWQRVHRNYMETHRWWQTYRFAWWNFNSREIVGCSNCSDCVHIW